MPLSFRFAATATAAAAVFAVPALLFAQADLQILVNNVGYEKSGAKRAVIQSGSALSAASAEVVPAAGGAALLTVSLGPQETVGGWSGRNFKVADFSDFSTDGEYRIRVGSVTSPAFSIGEKILQTKTGPDQLAFFKAYRSTDAGDKALPVFGSDKKVNMYGGWIDASGDEGKHISHLSYANYFNPQQIPLVAWALLHARDKQPLAFGAAALEEAAWGADYLLRALTPEGYFYMSVFDNWGNGYRDTPADMSPGTRGEREVCAWGHADGIRTGDYQCAMREGAGVSIAALARAAAAGASGDSSAAQYLAGAERAYAHLRANLTKYQDDKKENIIDDYCGLLAAVELYNATGEGGYMADARARAESLLGRQSPEGWFYSGTDASGGNIRPFYHAADEGLPIVALSRYYEAADLVAKRALREAIGKNLRFYHKITYSDGSNKNPFEYAKMYRAVGGGGLFTGGDLARNRPAAASREEASYTADKAFNGSATDGRWSSYQNGAQNDSQWISVELAEVYKVDRVVLNWESAYGKHYRIEVSANGTSWQAAIEIPNNESGGRKEHTFTPVDAKFVRMYGITRGYEYGGFSLIQFEVYGEPIEAPPAPTDNAARFFIPHDNETGYWWQGENARLASISAALAMGGPIAADSGGALWYDTLHAMATAQLDWILGKNPFELCMMHGHGVNNGPVYPAGRHENVKGGICNGITSGRENENDIEWAPYQSSETWWEDWRWIEQWIPHSAWYLTAVASLSYVLDHGMPPPLPPPEVGVKHSAAKKSARLKISAARGKVVRIALPFGADERTSVAIYDMRGKKVYAQSVPPGAKSVSVRVSAKVAAGAYVLAVKDAGRGNGAVARIVLR